MNHNFKVGDRVKAIAPCDNRDELIGEYGTIIKINKDAPRSVGVCFDKEFYFAHSLSGSCEALHGWWCEESSLELAEDNKKIVITTDGETTLARLYEGKKVIKTAEAKCSPDDTFDFNVGARIAMSRLIPDEPKFKAGDKVKIIGNTKVHHCFKLGDVVTICNVCCDGDLVCENSVTSQFVAPCDVELVTEPEKHSLLNTKICITNGDNEFKTGQIYDVVEGKIICRDDNPLPYDFSLHSMEELKDYFLPPAKRKLNGCGWSSKEIEFIEVIE